jgi:hypothetical protein
MNKTMLEGCVHQSSKSKYIFSQYFSWPMFQIFTMHSVGTITKPYPINDFVCVCKLSRVSRFLTQTISRVWWITQQDSLSRSETSLVRSYVNLNCFGFQLGIVTWNCEKKHCHAVTLKLRLLFSFHSALWYALKYGFLSLWFLYTRKISILQLLPSILKVRF